MHIIWPEEYQDIYEEYEGNISEASIQNPLPPKLPVLTDDNIDDVESKVVEKLVNTFNGQLKPELVNHTENSVDQVVKVNEKRLNLDGTSQQRNSQDSGARQSQVNQTTTNLTHHSTHEPPDVRIMNDRGNNNRDQSSNRQENHCVSCIHRDTCCEVQQHRSECRNLHPAHQQHH